MGIFGKTTPEPRHAEPTRPPGPAPAPAAQPQPSRRSACVIGAKTVLKGDLTGEEDIVVEGSVEGEIRIQKDLHVAAGGVVKATVQAASIVVSGELVGDCQATHKVEIQASGRLTGNIRAPRVVIAEGAVFKGMSDMSGRRDGKEQPAAAS
jgi:cytoskeletal protein CcmA (bactofilin family)